MATFNYKTYLAVQQDFYLVYVGFDKFSYGYSLSAHTGHLIFNNPVTDIKYI